MQLGKLLCQDNDSKKVVVQSVEIFNGRVAMLATVGMLLLFTYSRPLLLVLLLMLIYQVAFPASLFSKLSFISFFPFSPHAIGYAIQEAITGVAVIHESPEFFYPLFATLAIAWVERLW